MISFLAVSLALWLVYSWMQSPRRKADHSNLSLIEKLVTYGVLILGGYYLIKGSWLLGLVLLSIALSRVGMQAFWWLFLPDLPRPRFRTRFLEIKADLKTGQFEGSVREGRFAGRELKSMGKLELLNLYENLAGDLKSRDLLAAYLDRRHPGWREDAHADARAGQGGAGSSHALTQQEAYEILGLQEGAALEEISEAHRRLMKRLHPDTGGSTWLAAKINAAKDLLVKTHA